VIGASFRALIGLLDRHNSETSRLTPPFEQFTEAADIKENHDLALPDLKVEGRDGSSSDYGLLDKKRFAELPENGVLSNLNSPGWSDTHKLPEARLRRRLKHVSADVQVKQLSYGDG
jgi:hypothetical protein